MRDSFRCPNCGDEMHSKFERSHRALCALISRLMDRQVEQLMDDIWWTLSS